MQENIWGKQGCELPNGERCGACCILLDVRDSEFGEHGFQKGINEPCRYLVEVKDERGCAIHEISPKPCQAYHCSQSTPNVKLQLINTALEQGWVSQEEAQEAVTRLLLTK